MVLLSDITNSFDRYRRSSYTQRTFEIPRLKALVYNATRLHQTSQNLCVKGYISRQIPIYYGPKKVYLIEDQNFKQCLLNEACLELSKAFYNWAIYKMLVVDGLWSWGLVTLYYSQFYTINGLINLQGGDFSRPKLISDGNRTEKQVLFQTYTDNFEEGKFIFEMNHYKPHETIWERYYSMYKNYRYKRSVYSELHDYDEECRQNEATYLDLRHYINYDLTALFDRYIEYIWTHDKIQDFIRIMSQDIFENQESLSIDMEEYFQIEYFASLRIKLLFEMIYDVLDTTSLIPFRSYIFSENISLLRKIGDVIVLNHLEKWIREKNAEIA